MGSNVICLESSAPWPCCELSSLHWWGDLGEVGERDLMCYHCSRTGWGTPKCHLLGSMQNNSRLDSCVFKLLCCWWHEWLWSALSWGAQAVCAWSPSWCCQMLESTLAMVLPFLASLRGLGQCLALCCCLHKDCKMVRVICSVSTCCDSLEKLSAVSLLSSRCKVYHLAVAVPDGSVCCIKALVCAVSGWFLWCIYTCKGRFFPPCKYHGTSVASVLAHLCTIFTCTDSCSQRSKSHLLSVLISASERTHFAFPVCF